MADDILEEGREAFELIAEVESDNRKHAEDDIRFACLEEQWPEAIRKQRELDGRPCLTVNKLAAFTRQVLNDARQNKPAIKVHPADDNADVETAEVINGIIRNIEYTSNADVAYDTALESAVNGGFGYFTIDTQYACDDAFDLDLVINTVTDPFSIYGDPYATGYDSADWNTAFETQMVPKATFERQYKGADPIDWDDYSGLGEHWTGEGKTIRVAKWWRREKVARKVVLLDMAGTQQVLDADDPIIQAAVSMGAEVLGQREVESHKVSWSLMTGAEVIDSGKWAGRYIPIVPVYGSVVQLGGKRHLRSMIRPAIDSQRMFNYHRTTSTELLSLAPKAPFIGPKGAFDTDAEKWATANTQSWAYIEFDGGIAPQRQPFAGVPAGVLQEAANASEDIKSILGMFDASLGAGNPREESGRAILARQKEGDVGTFHYVDNLARAIRHAGRVLIDLIPSVYSAPRVMRVMGLDGSPQNVPVNKPYQAPQMGQDGKPQADPATGVAQTVERMHDLTTGKYDLVVKAGPSYSTKREEAANQMLELVGAFPAAAPVIASRLAKNLDWPEADEIARDMDAMKAQADPKAQMQAQAQAEMAKMQAQGQHKQAELQQEGALKQEQMRQDGALKASAQQQEIALKREQIAAELQLKREQLAAELDLKREQMVAEAQLSVMTTQHQMNAGADIGSDVHVGGDPG